MSRLCSSLLLSLGIASSASAVSMAWTPIGNPGNACDSQTQGCFGAVPYSYYIGTYEVTNVQYAEFLNAKAASDPLALYDTRMGTGTGGIARSGSSGSYSYSAIFGRGGMPVNYVNFYDALRFANWMNNGQGNGDTENGAYTITAQGISNNTITRNASATIAVTSENEWYKAAYYDSSSSSYLDYPAGSNTVTTCSQPDASANHANCANVVGRVSPVGIYTGSASPFGTFDQGGNVAEWTDTIGTSSNGRIVRGGMYNSTASSLGASFRSGLDAFTAAQNWGFRLTMIPEPGTGLLVIAGLLGLAGWRRGRA